MYIAYFKSKKVKYLKHGITSKFPPLSEAGDIHFFGPQFMQLNLLNRLRNTPFVTLHRL